MQFPKRIAPVAIAAVAALSLSTSALAVSTVIVTPAHPQGWYAADVRAGGQLHFITDSTSPYPSGALQLVTDGNTASKYQYLKDTTTPLGSVSELAYWTKQVAGPPEAAASFQLAVDLNGAATGGFTTLVYEPYWNGAVAPSVWQHWDVAAGQLWSSQTVTDGTCVVASGHGGAPFYTLAQLQAACPNAVVLSFGVNVGTYNLNYNVETDGVDFNGTTYDFQLANVPSSKDDCKKGGWANLTRADGSAFKNQGDCIQYVNTGK